MAWGTSWPANNQGWTTLIEPATGFASPFSLGIDLSMSDVKEFEQEFVLTQDTKLTFECMECDKLFDPDTVSFQTLLDKARANDWIIKWRQGQSGYDVYCNQCKDKHI